MLSNQQFVDPQIAKKFVDLEKELKGLLAQKIQIQSNSKLKQATKKTLLDCNEQSRVELRKLMEKMKLSMADYWDEQLNVVSKDCILQGTTKNKNPTPRIVESQIVEFEGSSCAESSYLSHLQDNLTPVCAEESVSYKEKGSIQTKESINKSSFFSGFRSNVLSHLSGRDTDKSLSVNEFNLSHRNVGDSSLNSEHLFDEHRDNRASKSLVEACTQKNSQSQPQKRKIVDFIIDNAANSLPENQSKSQKRKLAKRCNAKTRECKRLTNKVSLQNKIISSLVRYIHSSKGLQKDIGDSESIRSTSLIDQWEQNSVGGSLREDSGQFYSFQKSNLNSLSSFSEQEYETSFEELKLELAESEELAQLYKQKNMCLESKIEGLLKRIKDLESQNQSLRVQKSNEQNLQQVQQVITKHQTLDQIIQKNQSLRMQRKYLLRNISGKVDY